ncbi:hypothetical protein J4Q44_G00164100 [Coregonus suidteri]|uniref:Uncharacterized protein n=1 Tax=Coregonus suidteri TaxID=861788 RepID=A0AAN8LI02_9TELE
MSSSFQQCLSYTTLSDLALGLIDGTVYNIVQGLLDIQHLTGRNLYNQRQKLHQSRAQLFILSFYTFLPVCRCGFQRISTGPEIFSIQGQLIRRRMDPV